MDNLKLHIQIVHLLIQIKPFECENCSQAIQSWQEIHMHKSEFIQID